MSWLDPQEQQSSGAPGPALPDPWLDDQGGSEAAGSPASITSSTDSTSWSDGFDEIGGADFADFAGFDLDQPQADAYGASGAAPGPPVHPHDRLVRHAERVQHVVRGKAPDAGDRHG